MVSRVFSAGLSGIDGYIVTVECFLSGGLPRLDVVGLPTGAVSEAGERVRAAAKACAFDWPVSRLLWGYISDKLNIPVSQLSKDNIEDELTQYGVAP